MPAAQNGRGFVGLGLGLFQAVGQVALAALAFGLGAGGVEAAALVRL